MTERADTVVVKHKDSPESSSESCVSASLAENQAEGRGKGREERGGPRAERRLISFDFFR